ncbi:hypothetical protein BDP27DRAFT_318622 [Rhodocollybia butyracea]|uniref:Uncharacterized protein n=1 Tax=Rhodocollybia butyracea TaxID=206335 RepID=A0A9P5Q1T8_9AGAR|nr:hypothetical protein BDP27DRAFT_318622 [Rhodocollybia butyracea]
MTLNVIAPLSSLLSYVSAEPYSNSYLIWTKIEYLPSPVMIIVGDFLISWRAWIMWPGSRYIKAVLIVLMMANISFQCLYASSYMSVRVIQGALSLDFDSHWSTLLVSNVLGLFISLATSILSTSLIGVKAWMYRRDWRALRRHNRLTKAQQVLMLWIESGTYWLCQMFMLDPV